MSEHTNIQLDYMLQGKSREKTDVFRQAGIQYAQSRDEAERATVELKELAGLTAVKYGRIILESMASPELQHEVDLMQAEIEGRITKLGGGTVIAQSRAGRQFPDSSPVSEDY